MKIIYVQNNNGLFLKVWFIHTFRILLSLKFFCRCIFLGVDMRVEPENDNLKKEGKKKNNCDLQTD